MTWDELPDVEMRDFDISTMPARFATLGDEQDRGLGDAPYPPNFPKQEGEPPRVQPSRMNKANWGDEDHPVSDVEPQQFD